MKPWRKAIPLSQPLRGVRLSGSRSAREEFEGLAREREAEAYERGRVAGEQALGEQLLQQRGELLQLQQGVLASLTQSVPLLLREAEGVLIELALEAARKWMAAQPVDAQAIEASVRDATALMGEATEFTVLLNAEDLALLEKHNASLASPDASPARLRLSASPEVTRGGCIVQTRFGTVDARRETKVALLQNALQ
jgi:flagellar assembly protein FliH